MEKIMFFALVILLGGFLTNNESANSRDFNAGMVTPGKTRSMNQEEIITKAASIAVPFVKNAGQFNSEAKYVADLFAGRFFLTKKELVYSLRQSGENKIVQPGKHELNVKTIKNNASGKGIVFREYFVDQIGAKINFKCSGEQQTETVISYFKGNDPSKWRSGVASYQNVSLGQIYPGVEVKLKASGKNVEKVFYVSPQSDVADIKIGVSGVAGLKIDIDGRLLFKNSLADLAMRAPVAWQDIAGKRREIKVGYRLLNDHLYGFTIKGDYNRDFPLTIDPDLEMLMASTYLGGGHTDSAASLALDSSGNVFLTGRTESWDFPATAGAYDINFNISMDAFVAKLDSGLTTLLAATYLGGSAGDDSSSLALDGSGNVYVAGTTISADFPTTAGAYDTSNTYTNTDIFICKLDNGLTSLLASTFLGENGSEFDPELITSNFNNIYVAGRTDSPDFPTTPEAYDRTYNGGDEDDVFVAKLDGNLTTLMASTFLGGSGTEYSPMLALDSYGNVYLTGCTDSKNFPITIGAYDQDNNGAGDIFVSKMNENLTALLASTFLGGSKWDWGFSLVLDSVNDVYLTGLTHSSDFPTTTGAYDRSYNGLNEAECDAFISKLNSNLTELLASTYLGGSLEEGSSSLALDSSGNVYVIGNTESADFPTTPEAYDQTHNGANDVFICKLNKWLTMLLASTFLGGSDGDHGFHGRCLALDGSGKVYVAGGTASVDFPTTTGAYDRSYNAGVDVWVSKLNNSLSGEMKLDLKAERREARAFSIVRQYGQIQCTVETLNIQVAQYRVMRWKGSGDFALLKTVAPSELQNNQFQMQDKYLEKDVTYTYRVEAYNAAAQLIGISLEKTI